MIPAIIATCIPLSARMCDMPASENKSRVEESRYALSPNRIVIRKFCVSLCRGVFSINASMLSRASNAAPCGVILWPVTLISEPSHLVL